MTSSVFSANIGNVEAIDVYLTGTSATDIVSESGPTTILNVHVANIDTSSAVAVTIEAYKVSTTTPYYLCFQKDVPAKDFIDIEVGPLAAGWKLRATAATGNKLYVRALYTLPTVAG